MNFACIAAGLTGALVLGLNAQPALAQSAAAKGQTEGSQAYDPGQRKASPATTVPDQTGGDRNGGGRNGQGRGARRDPYETPPSRYPPGGSDGGSDRRLYNVGIDKKGPGPVAAGQSAMFGLYPYNVGPSPVDASTGVTVTDTLPASFTPPLSYTANGWSCATAGLTLTCHYTGGTVGAGQSLPPITVSAIARTQGGYSNCADVTIKPKDANGRNDRSCIDGVVTPPKDGVYDVGIDKKGTGPVAAGQSASFGLYPYNVGPSAVSASTGVTVTDTLPANFTPPLSYTANGWACTTAGLTLTCHYTGGTVAAGQALPPITVSAVARTQGDYSNCAGVGIKPKDANARNDRSCVNGVVTPPKDGVYDVGIEKKGPGPIVAGQSAMFGLYPYNVGPSAVSASTGVTVTDTLPANFIPPLSYTANGWACTTASLTLTCHYTGGTVGAGQALPPITVSAVARTQGGYTNCSDVGIKPKDNDSRNNRSCIDGTVTGSGKPTAVCVTKYNDLNGNGMLDSGEPPLANWQFTIRNSAGVIVAQGVTKANGGFCTVTETLQPNWVSTDPGGSAPQKTVTAVSGQTVQALFGNRAGRITKPSLTIEKVVTQDCSGSPPNTLCKFMVRVFNTGQAPYTGPLTFTDLVTSFGSPTGGVSLAPPYPPGWSCTGVQPLSCSSGSVTLQLGSFVAVPLNMNINGAVPPNRNCASLTAPMAAGPSCVTVGSTHYDLLIDSNFMNAPGAPGFHDLSFYVSSTPAPPPGTQLIVNGSLTSNVTFAPRTVIGSSWTCSGPWTGFVCTLTMPSGYGGGTPVLTLRTSYPSAGSGHAVTYAGTVTKNNNIDPNPANNTRTVNSTLP